MFCPNFDSSTAFLLFSFSSSSFLIFLIVLRFGGAWGVVGFGWFLFLGGGVWVVCWLNLLGCGGGGGEGRCGWDTRRLNLSSIELETLLLRVASGLVRFSLMGWGCGGGWLDLWLVSSLVGGGGTFGGGGGWCGVCLWLKSGFRGLFGITEDRVVGDGGGGWSCWLR